MKLIMAIVQDVDSRGVLDALVAEGYRATKVSTTGGFLVRGNATILIGLEYRETSRAHSFWSGTWPHGHGP